MKTLLSLMLLAFLCAPPARADTEGDKAASGEKFLETGGKGSVADGSGGVVAGEGGSSRDAEELINSRTEKKTIDGKNVPKPDARDSLAKGLNGGKWAVGLGVVGGVAGGLLGGPFGLMAGAAAGAAVGFAIGFALGGKEANDVQSKIESHNSMLDEISR